MSMKMSPEGLNLLKLFEGYKATPYKDSGGKPTIGYGHLIKPGEVFGAVSNGQASALLAEDISWAETVVTRGVTRTISQPQFDALVSFTYNVGSGAFTSSTLLKDINGGLGGALTNLHWLAWNKVTVDGQLQPLKSLYNRRVAENTLYSTGDYGKAMEAYRDA